MMLQIDFGDTAFANVLSIQHTEGGQVLPRMVQLHKNVTIIFVSVITSLVTQTWHERWLANDTFRIPNLT